MTDDCLYLDPSEDPRYYLCTLTTCEEDIREVDELYHDYDNRKATVKQLSDLLSRPSSSQLELFEPDDYLVYLQLRRDNLQPAHKYVHHDTF